MATFGIEFLANPYYEVQAESPEEALEIAMQWYEEYMPDYRITEITTDEDAEKERI